MSLGRLELYRIFHNSMDLDSNIMKFLIIPLDNYMGNTGWFDSAVSNSGDTSAQLF